MFSFSSEAILVGNVGQFDREPFRGGVGEDTLNNGSLVLLTSVLDGSFFLSRNSVFSFVTAK
jgi:hypothetical protein